jgi:hypothetical protein
MVAADALQDLARKYLADARVLQRAERYDAAIYLGGYAIELALKARICYTLNWLGYPDSNSEFQHYQSFRTHNLDVLLALSGIKTFILTNYLAAWSRVAQWTPQMRYNRQVPTRSETAEQFIRDLDTLLEVIL